LQRPLQLAGRWLARRFVARYRKRSRAGGWDIPRDELDWYTRLHAMLTGPRRHLSKVDRERTHVSPGAQRIVSEVSLGRVERVVAHDEPDVLERNESGVERAGPAMSR
jgi:hypothetical protein